MSRDHLSDQVPRRQRPQIDLARLVSSQRELAVFEDAHRVETAFFAHEAQRAAAFLGTIPCAKE
jgi:hypothetical protein